MAFPLSFATLIFLLVLLAASAIRILREYERGVVFQLGRFWKVKGPGLVLIIPAIQQMTARNVQGSTSIVIQFDLGRDIDQAAADVQAAIARTLRRLPPNLTAPPSYHKVNPADAPVLLIALHSDSMAIAKLDEFAENFIAPTLSTIGGVGQVQVFGQQQYAVRVELDPNALAARGIGLDQVTSAVAASNSIAPVGTLNGTSARPRGVRSTRRSSSVSPSAARRTGSRAGWLP